MVPFLSIGLSSIFRLIHVNVTIYGPPRLRGALPVAAGGWRRPMALNRTGSESQKSEHVSARGISLLERDLRPF